MVVVDRNRKKMRKLIIGCGYLGKRVAVEWLRDGHEVSALTRSEEHAAVFRQLGIEPIIGDVTRPSSLAALPEVETVLYAVGFDRNGAASKRDVYVGGLENVLNVIAGRTGRLSYISSISVYGQSDGELVDETSECIPARPDGGICLDAERLVRRLLPEANVLRLAGIYGPGRLLSRIETLRSGDPLPGNPDGWLNLIHVDDAVGAVLACEDRGRPGETYLVCDDKPVRRREYYELLADLTDTPAPTFATGVEASRGTGLNKRCCNRKLREELEMQLRFPTIQTGLPNAVAGDQ